MRLRPRPPPSTGFSRAVAAVVLGSLFFGLAFMHRVAPSVMTAEWMRDFSVSAGLLGTLSGWYFYAYASMQLPVGLLNDRFGSRQLMSVALLACAVASLGFALCESLLLASVLRAVIGASVAFAFISTLAIANAHFAPARFAFLAGAVQTFGMLGAVLGQAPLRYAVEQFGWRATVLALSGVAVLLAVLVWLIVPNAPRAAPKSAPTTNWRSGLVAVLANPQSWACCGIGFGMTAIMLGFAGLWAVPWLSSVHGYTVPEAAGLVSLLFLGWAVGAPLSGWWSDYSGKRKPIMGVGIWGNLLLFALLLFGGVRAPVVLGGLFLLLGLSGSMMTVAFASMREVNLAQQHSTAMSLVNMFVVGSGAVMQPVIGFLLDLNWDGSVAQGAPVYQRDAYKYAFYSLFAANFLALTCLWRLRETACKPLNPP